MGLKFACFTLADSGHAEICFTYPRYSMSFISLIRFPNNHRTFLPEVNQRHAAEGYFARKMLQKQVERSTIANLDLLQ